MKSNRRNKNRISQIALLTLFTGMGVYANAGEFVFKDNKLTIVGSGASAGFNQSVTIDNTGAISNIANVPTSSGVGIPSFNFEIIQTNVAGPATYTFTVGVIFDDDANDSRLETKITTLELAVDASGKITGSIPAQSLRLLGRTSDGAVQIQADITNAADNGPISITGGSVSFDGADLISRIRNSNRYFKDVILPEFDRNASYTYTIVLEQIGGAAQQFGIDSDASEAYNFQAFPDAAGDTFILNSNELAADFPSAQRVTGKFNVVLDSGGSTEDTTNTASGASTATNTATSAVDAVFTGGGTPTPAQINNLVSASQQLNSVLTNTSPKTVTTSDLSSLGASVKGLVQTNTKNAGSSSPSTLITSNTNAVLSSAATLLKGFSEKETLTAEDAKAGLDIVKDLLTNAPGFFAGSNEDDKNLKSMTDLLAATFALGAKANPPVVFEAKDYAGAVKALDDLTKKKEVASGACGTRALSSGLNASAIISNPLLQNQLWWFGTPNPTPPATTQVFEFAPLNVLPNFQRQNFAWMNDFEFDSKFLTFNVEIGPCGRVTTGITIAASSAEQIASNPLVLAATAPFIEPDLETLTVKVNIGNKKLIGAIYNTVLVPSNFPNGTITQPNGTILWIQQGLAYNMGSSAADFVKFGEAVEGAGYNVSVRSDGGFDIQTGPNEKLSGVFAYDNVAGLEGTCGSVSITPPVGAVTSPEYAFTATCATSGLTQRIVPYVGQSDFYAFGNFSGAFVSTDRDTGIINIEGLGSFKPSFFTYALTANDQAFLTDNETAGLAFRRSDVNGDGKIDYEMLHSSGVQVLYGL